MSETLEVGGFIFSASEAPQSPPKKRFRVDDLQEQSSEYKKLKNAYKSLVKKHEKDILVLKTQKEKLKADLKLASLREKELKKDLSKTRKFEEMYKKSLTEACEKIVPWIGLMKTPLMIKTIRGFQKLCNHYESMLMLSQVASTNPMIINRNTWAEKLTEHLEKINKAMNEHFKCLKEIPKDPGVDLMLTPQVAPDPRLRQHHDREDPYMYDSSYTMYPSAAGPLFTADSPLPDFAYSEPSCLSDENFAHEDDVSS